MEYFEGIIDEVDAAVFSGDSLVKKKNRKLLKESCESWLREIGRMEEAFGKEVKQ
jgi:hypothetical protein